MPNRDWITGLGSGWRPDDGSRVGGMSDPTTVSGADVPWPAGELGDRLRFLVEIDRLKTISRRSLLHDGSRRENSAEHSWHLAMMAMVLHPHAAGDVDLARVVEILLVHDIVEVDAGDTYAYDAAGYETKDARECAAADRLYGLLPSGDGQRLRALWEEYEAGDTAEAQFAASCDRLQPMLLNFLNDGRSWREHGVGAEQVRSFNAVIDPGSPQLWAFASALIDDARGHGWFAAEPLQPAERVGAATGTGWPGASPTLPADDQ